MRSVVMYAQGLGLRMFEAQEMLRWDWEGLELENGEGPGQRQGMIVTQPRLLLKVQRGEGGGGGSSSASGSPPQGGGGGRWQEVVAAKIERY